MKYPIIIHKDAESDYGVTVPDLPGCFSAGISIEDAIEQTQEAILTHVEGLLCDAESIPQPTSIESHIESIHHDGEIFLAFVDVDLSQLSGNVKRVNISIPERLLNTFDRYAKAEGESRSGFLIQAALAYVQKKEK